MIAALLVAVLAAQDKYEPYVAPASGDGEAAIARFKVPDGLEVKLWAAEPRLANPVAMCVSNSGDVYVAETFRLKSGVDDIRDHMDWLDDDVACRTVEDRVAYLKKRLGDKFAAYSKDSERVRWIADTDGDGVADKDSVFADGFNDPADGIAASLLAWKDKLYYTCIPSLWALGDKDGDHVADTRDKLSTGYGIRFALIGHDLHGLAIGPDGKLYFSCGDRGFNVSTREGARLHNEFCGAVLRCNLDGSELEVFATGLRNPQDLVFDEYGELFTVDNNSDGGDKARLVHVIEGMDAGWRQSYQWLNEPNLRGAWNDEKLWNPHFDGQAAYIVPPLANICDGPSGLAYNPGTALTPEWRNHFFVCDFRGTPSDSGIQTFTLKPKGSSFELDKFEHFVWGTLATDLDFGPDGALYWSDWVEGWGETGKGRIYRISPAQQNASAGQAQAQLLADLRGISDVELFGLLDSPDQRVRRAAQLELPSQTRGNDVQIDFQFGIDAVGNPAAHPATKQRQLHAIWALAANAYAWPDAYHGTIETVAHDDDPRVRAQAARAMGHSLPTPAVDERELVRLVGDPDAVVRREAAISLGKRGFRGAVGSLIELARSTSESDPALRHAAIFGLEHCATADQLVSLKSDKFVDVRVAAVVALRRQKQVGVAQFLGDSDPRVVTEAARAIYDVPIEAAYPQLAILIGQMSSKETALVRRVINANFRLGAEANARALAKFAAREDTEELHRWEAIDLLSKWAEPPGRDSFTGEWWPLPKRDAGFMAEVVSDMRKRGIESAPTKVLVAWIKLAEQSGANDQAIDFVGWAKDSKRDLKVRVAALRAAKTLSPRDLEPALGVLVGDSESKVRAAALEAIQVLAPAQAMPLLEQAALNGSRDERRVAYAALAKIDDARADAMFARELGKLRAGFVPSEVALDLVEGAEQRKADNVKKALDALIAPRAIDTQLAPFADCLYGGEKDKGKRIFREKAETTCLRCHRIEWNEGGQVGPDLNGVGKRLSRVEILESIADPNRRISHGYQAIVITLNNDQHVVGIVVSETPDRVTVRTAQDELVEVDTAEIAARRPDLSAMPQDVSKFLSRDEMRDVIEYLANL